MSPRHGERDFVLLYSVISIRRRCVVNPSFS